MLSIRFLRIGKKNQPSYKIVVVDKRRSPKSGKFIEQLGFYNPITKEKGVKKERAQYWLSKGAQPSDTVYNLLIREGVVEGKKIAVHSTKQRKKEEAPREETKKEPQETTKTENSSTGAEGTVIKGVKEGSIEEKELVNKKNESHDSSSSVQKRVDKNK